MALDMEKLKNSLTNEQILRFLQEAQACPLVRGDMIVAKTVCHNHKGEGSHKLYYYPNTHLFKCYTGCDATFDIFELTQKIFSIEGQEISLPQAISYVANFFNIPNSSFNIEPKESLVDWDILENYENISSIEMKPQMISLKEYDGAVLSNLPQPHILNWEKEGITFEVAKLRGIRYNPVSDGIVIPHFNIDNKLIGIRERTLVKEYEKWGKYRPAIINNIMYNHPLGFNLYNLNNSKENIKLMKKAIIFEGEKSTLLYASLFGVNNDITVATCGNSLINYQVQLLLSLGVDEIIIAYDRQFKVTGDPEWQQWTQKLKNIHSNYSKYCTISFLFDTKNLLDYKDSPVDKGADTFLELFKNRIYL